jgi:hypothetical protein
MRNWLALALWLAAVSAIASTAYGAEQRIFSFGENPCTGKEKWVHGQTVPEDFREEFEAFLNKKRAPVRGFSEALALRRIAESDEARAFGEYWIARSLYEAKLVHIAHGGFSAIVSRPIRPETAGVQLAALGCLSQINHRFPTLATPAAASAQLDDYLKSAHSPALKEVVWHAALIHMHRLFGEEKYPKEGIQAVLKLLKGAGSYEAFAKSLWASRRGDHQQAITEMKKFVADPSLPGNLKSYLNIAHIMIARSLYTVGRYGEAANHYKSVEKRSNELATALSELAWANLMDEKYNEAIGTAMNLQAGGLRHTFAPEAPMVMAMALNEICQFPESVRAVSVFRRNYEKPYNWLSDWDSKRQPGKPEPLNLYAEAVAFLKKKSKVPDRIGTEWVRSPVFLSSQDELNLIFDEKDSSAALSKTGAREQKQMAEQILAFARELKPRYKLAKMKLQAGQSLPRGVLNDLASLKKQVVHLRRLQQGAPTFKKILANYSGHAGAIENRLIAGINQDLTQKNYRMLRQLEEIAENSQLIEVEIYNGASQDIIWQNAHPDYKLIAQKLKDEKEKRDAGKVWNWGKTGTGLDDEDGGEIWEDELGSFKADLYDNCSSKDKYLALKRGN